MTKTTKNVLLATGLVVAMAVVAVVVMVGGVVPNAPHPQSNEAALTDGRGDMGTSRPVGETVSELSSVRHSQDDETSSDDDSAEAVEPQTEEEKREAEEEKKVDAFDELTDKWMEPAEKGVTMADVDNFAKQFCQVPKARQDECVHRALNLIPDENVMLLAGILMDKSIDTEIVETVFNDILNRDENLKKPILQQIFKDKTHPCWADAAWILDVTDELPKKQ